MTKEISIDYTAILGSARGYAVVYRGHLEERPAAKRSKVDAAGVEQQDRKPVAVKRIQLVHIRQQQDREEIALRKLNHRNVVKLLHVKSDSNFM